MKLETAFADGRQTGGERFNPQTVFLGFAALAFPIIDRVYGAFPLGTSCQSFVDQSASESLGIGFRLYSGPANVKSLFCRVARTGLFVARDRGNNRLTPLRFKVKGRIPFFKRRHSL